MASFRPTSLSVAKTNVRVRSEAGRAAEPPEGDALQIWKIADPVDISFSTPVSVDVTYSKRIEFHVTLERVEIDQPTKKFNLSAKFVNNTMLTFEDTTFDGIDNPISIYLNGWDNVRPWGIDDKIKWYITPHDDLGSAGPTSDQYAVERTIPLELYAITPKKLLPSFFKNEIPAELLKIFILPTMRVIPTIKRDEEGEMASYIKYAAAVCHRSKMDKTAMENTELGTFDPVHSYQYSALNGGPHFGLSKIGGHFPIKEWIDQRFRTEYNKINCYDQAALLQVVGSLGIIGESTKLVWNYLWPYGYIKKTDLVGWGMCNSPYHPMNPGNDFGPRDLEATSPERQGFKNHAFIIMGEGSDRRFLDACAGPHFGNENKEQYIKAARDFEHPEPPKGWVTDEGGDWKPLDDNIMEPFARVGVISLKIQATATRSHSADTALFKSTEDHSAATTELHDRSVIQDAKDEEYIHVDLDRLNKILSYRGFTAELDSGNDEGTRSLRWESFGGAVTMVVEVEVYKSNKGAINAWNTFFYSHSRSYQEVFERPAPEDQKGNNNLVGVEGVEQDVWRRGNVFVNVSKGPGGDGGIVGVVSKQIDECLKEAHTKIPAEHEFGEIKLLASTSSPLIGAKFTITINITEAAEIKPVIKNHNVFLVEDPDKSSDGTWVFTFRAISEGAESIQFVCSHKRSCLVIVREQDLNVLPRSG